MTDDFKLRFNGAYSELPSVDRSLLFERGSIRDAPLFGRVAAIIDRVRTSGDAALREMAGELDGVDLDELEVRRESLVNALDNIPSDLRRSMERSANNIRRFHEEQLPRPSSILIEPGVTVGRRPDPLARPAPSGRGRSRVTAH